MSSTQGQQLSHRLVAIASLIAGYAFLFLSIMISVEVITRKFFGFSFQGVDEVGGYALAIGCAFSFGYALLLRGHTRVDILLVNLPPPVRALLNVVAALSMAAFAVFMAWQGWVALDETLEFDSRASTPLQTPLWIPQTLWVAGMVVFALIALLIGWRGLIDLLRARFSRVNALLDPRTTDDELDEALENAQELLQTQQGGKSHHG